MASVSRGCPGGWALAAGTIDGKGEVQRNCYIDRRLIDLARGSAHGIGSAWHQRVPARASLLDIR